MTFKYPPVHILIAAAFCLTLYLIGIYCRPVFPVDETRYLTVAWEMFSSGNYILPHLNFEPYDHKPPLLFWSINFLWLLFGVSEHAAMAVPFLFAFALVYMTQRLARHMLPEEKNFPAIVTYVLLGSLPFIVYSNMIMFDLILGVFAVSGLTAIWDYAHSGDKKHLGLYALAVGLGAITKGPVILLHTPFPIVFVRFWHVPDGLTISRAKWAGGFVLAIIGGVILGLCWAIPAAIQGGPAFADKIFWGQTAGRVANAFDHRHPFWWYLPYIPVLLAPWIFSPLFWRGIRNIKQWPDREILRFIALWLPPVFMCFCFISGKQVHYLVPLVPGFALLTGLAFIRMAPTYRRFDAVPPFIFNGLAILGPAFIKIAALKFGFAAQKPVMLALIREIDFVIPVILFIIASTAVFVMSRRGLASHVMAITFTSLLLMASFQLEARNGLFKNYNLAPVAEIIEKYPKAPLAFARNYHGEFGFLARLQRPVKEVYPPDLPEWFKQNPNGMAMIRTGHRQDVEAYDVIFTKAYQADDAFDIIVPKGRGKNFIR